MKLLVILALVCALFFEVYPLDCYKCIPTGTTACTQTAMTCPSNETKCASVTATVQTGEGQTEIKAKACAATTECTSGSVNFGVSESTFNTQCCDSDLCNSQFPPSLVSNPNGKKCFTCVGNDCTQTLECKGSEDRCVKSTVTVGVQSVNVKGCASQSICSGNVNSQIANLGVNLNCCEGDLCNSALRIGQSILFLLLVPLASFILFS